MKIKKLLALFLCTVLFVPVVPGCAEDIKLEREVEYLSRGGYGVVTDNGIYLSWRLLGTEPIKQTFDIYRNNEQIARDIDNLNYT